jgi:hypothetical protein
VVFGWQVNWVGYPNWRYLILGILYIACDIGSSGTRRKAESTEPCSVIPYKSCELNLYRVTGEVEVRSGPCLASVRISAATYSD